MIAGIEGRAAVRDHSPPLMDTLGAAGLSQERLDELAAIAEDRSRIYWLLSQLFLNPPDEGLLAGLRSVAEARQPAPGDGLTATLVQLCEGLHEAAETDDLRIECLRLFGGVREGYGPPPPFESLYREGRLFGESTESVIDHYRKNGYSLAYEETGPEDHLGIELKFLALLCYRERTAWNSGDTAGGRSCLAAERAFIEEHLQSWVPAYCEGLEKEASAAFYRAVAKLTAESIAFDARQVAGMLAAFPPVGAEEDKRGDQP